MVMQSYIVQHWVLDVWTTQTYVGVDGILFGQAHQEAIVRGFGTLLQHL